MKYFVELSGREDCCPCGRLLSAKWSIPRKIDWWCDDQWVFCDTNGVRRPVDLWEDDTGYLVDLP